MKYVSIIIVTLLLALSIIKAEEVDGEEWIEEELIYRDGNLDPTSLPKLPARPPFTLHDYEEEKHTWIVPLDEEKTLKESIKSAYERMRIVHGKTSIELIEVEASIGIDEDGYEDNTMKTTTVERVVYGMMPVAGISEMVYYILNPDEGEISLEEKDMIDTEISQLLEREGLDNYKKELALGFLNAGGPFRAIKKMLIRMRNYRRFGNDTGAPSPKSNSRKNVEQMGNRRKLQSKEKSHRDLWEHEIVVDQVRTLPKGWGRKLLEL